MTIHADDPRLTAYALGELSDEERAEVQRELKDSPEAQAELSAIGETAELLIRELSGEQAASLADEQRDQIRSIARENALTKGATAGLSSSAQANRDGDSTLVSTQSHSDDIVKPGASAPGKFARISYESPAGATSDADQFAAAPLGLDIQVSNRSPGADAPGYTPSPVPGDSDGSADAGVSESPFGGSSADKDAGQTTTAANALAKTKPKSSRRRLLITLSVAASWVVVAVSAYLTGAWNAGRTNAVNQLTQLGSSLDTYKDDGRWQESRAIRENENPDRTPHGSETAANLSGVEGRNVVFNDLRQLLKGGLPNDTSNANPRAVETSSDGKEFAGATRAKLGYADEAVLASDYLASDSDASGIWRSGDYDVPFPDRAPLYYPPAEEWRRLTDARQRFDGIDLDGDGNGVLDEDEVQFETRARDPSFNTEAYDRIVENRFQDVTQYPLSTFSIDVDTASYANVRRMLNSGRLPPPGAVRIEEFVNYFDYDYAPPDGTEPFAVRAEVASCPWRPAHRLVRIGIKGRQIAVDKRPASNLVFLLDVSGSMNDPAKLPLVKQGMRLLVERLGENDRVAIVVYAGASGLALDSTSGADKPRILAAIDQLQPGGSTNGAGGIELAYQIAERYLIAGGVNRVILATDGDFNVGVTDQSQLVEMIEDKATGGVFLSVLGFGMGNLQDSTLEKLADHGNGNYAYIDTLREANKVLVRQLDGTLVTIAKDVKIQLEFNPVKVAAYRLIGYENRMLAKEDFNDDTKDAGEIGAGHTVTSLYEVVPTGEKTDVQTPAADDLEYQVQTHPTEAAKESPNLLTLKLRYKQPDGQESKLLRFPVEDADRGFAQADGDFQFASAVAAFGMLLRNSAYRGDANYDAVLEYATNGLAADEHGYRAEFVELVKASRDLSRGQTEDSASP